MFSVLVLLAILSVTLAVDFDCGNYNNNCVSCIQATAKGNMAHSCSFCSVDGICHTVGSLFNKCKPEECVSLSEASSCKMNTVEDCSFTKPYGKHLR